MSVGCVLPLVQLQIDPRSVKEDETILKTFHRSTMYFSSLAFSCQNYQVMHGWEVLPAALRCSPKTCKVMKYKESTIRKRHNIELCVFVTQ